MAYAPPVSDARAPLSDVDVPQDPALNYIGVRDQLYSILQDLASPYLQSEFRTDVMSSDWDEIKALESIDSLRLRITFISERDAGTSSTINSLLRRGEIARTGESRIACTWAVQEFAAAQPDQTHQYRAIIEYHTAEKAKIVVEQLVADAIMFIKGEGDNDDGCPIDPIDILVQLFQAYPEYNNKNNLRHFLVSNTPNVIIETMSLKTIEMNDQLDVLHQIASEQIDTDSRTSLLAWVSDYVPSLARLGEVHANPHTAKWPLVAGIRFYISWIPLLDSSVTLVDIPLAIFATNEAREQRMTDALESCPHYAVVTRIEEAMNQATRDRLAFCNSHGHVFAICTHVDQIGISREQEQEARSIRTRFRNATADVRRVLTRVGAGPELDDAIEKAEDIKFQPQQHLRHSREENIERRIGNVLKRLRRDFRDRNNEPKPLELYCVSSTVYDKYVYVHGVGDTDDETGNSLAMTGLSWASTGIPALRKALYNYPALQKLLRMEDAITSELPGLLARLKAWGLAAASSPELDICPDEKAMRVAMISAASAAEERLRPLTLLWRDVVGENPHERLSLQRLDVTVEST